MKFTSAAKSLKLWRVRIIVAIAVVGLIAMILPSNATTTPTLGSSGAFKAGTWVSIPLSGLPYDPTVSIEISTMSSTPIAFASREDTQGRAPQIVKTSSQGTVTVVDSADSSITREHPNTNYGTSPWLFVEATRDIRSYMKFNLPTSVAQPGTTGTQPDLNRTYVLRLFALTSNTKGINVRATGVHWTESGPGSITYNTRPLRKGTPLPPTTTIPPVSTSPVTTHPVTTTPVTVPVTSTPVTTTAPPTTVVHLRSSISNNCSVDVTTDIQSAINALPDGKTLQLDANACYLVNGTLRFVNRNNVTFDGNGATLKQTTDGSEAPDPRKRSMVSFEGGSNLTAENIIIQGAEPVSPTLQGYVVAREAQMGFNLIGVQGAVIKNNSVYNVWGDGVYLGVLNNDLTRNVTVSGNHIDGTGREGLSLIGVENIVAENNYIADNSRCNIDIEPNHVTDAIRHVIIRNNTMGPRRLNFISNYGAAAPMEDINILNNHLVGGTLTIWSSDQGANLHNRTGYTVSGNTTDTPAGEKSGASIQFTGVDNIVVSNNNAPQEVGRSMSLVLLNNVTNAQVANNTITNGIAGIKVGAGDQNLCFSGNKIGNPLVAEPASAACTAS